MTVLARIARGIVDRFMGGRGEFSITVPVMDGPLQPNEYLERTAGLGHVDGADNVVVHRGRLLVSSENRIIELNEAGEQRLHSEHDVRISCLAISPGGALAVGLDGRGVRIVGGKHDGKLLDKHGSGQLHCPTSAAFLDEDTLIVSNGSKKFAASDWKRDFLNRGRSGTVSRIRLPDKRAIDLARGLRFPAGICLRAGSIPEVVVSEAWRHRLVALATDRPSLPREIVAGLPAYPCRICPSASGGYWLALFAPRSQLQEFVLREPRFRRRMIAEIDPEFWIAPALSSGHSFKEPLQAGGVIRLGIHKPWAPTRSYGLLVRLDQDFQPVWSAHSRANGTRHGITALVEWQGKLVATSKGRGEVIGIDHTALAEPDDLADHMEYAA